MDPVGFALENYDAIGRWRDLEEGLAVDASGGLPDGSKFNGVEGLEQGLLQRPELFAGTLTEKLLTYALGRGPGLSRCCLPFAVLSKTPGRKIFGFRR